MSIHTKCTTCFTYIGHLLYYRLLTGKTPNEHPFSDCCVILVNNFTNTYIDKGILLTPALTIKPSWLKEWELEMK
jgi:hypothetical protein